MLHWLRHDKGIAPHIPVWERSARQDGTFESSVFLWDASANAYHCPGGHVLRSEWRTYRLPRTHITKADSFR